MISDADKQTLDLLARPNWRGVGTEYLVYDIQDVRAALEYAIENPREDFKGTKECPGTEDREGYLYYCEQSLQGLEDEIERRRKLQYEGVLHTNKEIIEAIKAATRIEDVLSWYTDVFLHKKTWTYRCTLHGDDKHPSGVIYPEEKRCHCYACQKGGDVFDVVQAFERATLPQAIAKLARNLGLDIKPLVRHDKKLGFKDITA